MNIDRRVLSMKYAGYDINDISHALSMSPQQVSLIIDRAIAVQVDEHRATYIRESELAKLDEMEESYLNGAIEGEHKSAYLTLKIMERRSAILGLDKQQAAVSINVNLVGILSDMSKKEMFTIEEKAIAE